MFTFSQPVNHGVSVWKKIICLRTCSWNGRLYIVTAIQVTLMQSTPVIWYSVKRIDSHGEKKGRRKMKRRLLNMFSNIPLKEKKYWIFNSWQQLGLWQVWWCAECLPKCSGAQGKGLQSRIPLFPFFLKWKAEGEEASSMAVSYETVTISLHDHRRAKYICFMHIILSGKAREYKKENMVFFSAARCWSASKILMFINR